MFTSREKLLTKQSALLDVPETMELTAPSPTASPEDSPNVSEIRRQSAPQRRPRQSIDGVQLYHDLVQSNSFLDGPSCPMDTISIISDPQNTGMNPNGSAKPRTNNNAQKNGLAKTAWRNKRSKGGGESPQSTDSNKEDKRRESCSARAARLSLTPSPPEDEASRPGNQSGRWKMKLRAIGKFSTLENMCKNQTTVTAAGDPLNSGDVCLMEHNPNRIFKVCCQFLQRFHFN